MSNHLHLIAGSKDGYILSDILRDFKKFTSKAIIKCADDIKESRREWMLNRFGFRGANDKKIKFYKVWKDGNEAKEIYSSEFLQQKLDYIHNNPVKADIVDLPEQYRYSSARNYRGRHGLLDVIFIV